MTTDNGQQTTEFGQRTTGNGQRSLDNRQRTTEFGQRIDENMEGQERKLENMRIWQNSRLFTVSIYNLFKNNRDYGFKDQIQRASVSIMNNIAEGFESGSDSMFIKYLNVSKGSCSEVKSMLYLSEDLAYCTKQQREELQSQLKEISNGIYKLIEWLKSTQQS